MDGLGPTHGYVTGFDSVTNCALRGWPLVDRRALVAYVRRNASPLGKFSPLMFFTFLLVVHALVAASLVGVILMQRSEGGGLGMGGSPGGLMSARGTADFLTRATSILATVFIAMSILLAFMAASRQAQSVDASLARKPTAPLRAPGAPAPTLGEAPSAAAVAAAAANGNSSAPAPTVTLPGGNSAVPLEQ